MITKERTLFLYWRTIQILSYLCYIISALYVVGFIKTDYTKEYLNTIENVTKIIVSLFLMWKFNMFRKNIYISKLDQSIVFHCALFLLLTTWINNILVYYVNYIKQKTTTNIQKTTTNIQKTTTNIQKTTNNN
jgi:uncharacterized membrane protein YbjE (DUF340 family)